MSHARAQLPHFNEARAFESWAETQRGRWELHDGVPVAMAPERLDHARLKAQTWLALRNAIKSRSLTCEAVVDGPLVPGPGLRRFLPDVTVARGNRIDGDDQIINSPVILVEVLSPSTEATDTELKLDSYVQLPSLQHYLIISSTAKHMAHHRRANGTIETSFHKNGIIELNPPGLSISLDDIYSGTNIAP